MFAIVVHTLVWVGIVYVWSVQVIWGHVVCLGRDLESEM